MQRFLGNGGGCKTERNMTDLAEIVRINFELRLDLKRQRQKIARPGLLRSSCDQRSSGV